MTCRRWNTERRIRNKKYTALLSSSYNLFFLFFFTIASAELKKGLEVKNEIQAP